MTFTEFALRMYPWWIAGWAMILAVLFSPYKDMLRIDKKAVVKFVVFLILISIYRAAIFYFFGKEVSERLHLENINIIPWPTSLTVFWEDAIHTLPIAILLSIFGEDRWYKKVFKYAIIAIVMCAFGLGHVYQGLLVAFLLSFYIPFTLKKGKEYGFGTVMICHCLYDLSTMLIMKAFF